MPAPPPAGSAADPAGEPTADPAAGPTPAAPPPAAALVDLRARLPALTLRDEHRIGRRLDGIGRVRGDEAHAAALAQLWADVEAAERRVERRRTSVPAVDYPADLPVSARRGDLLAALGQHQVVVVSGETGSGKTTQLPKMLLELGRGVRGAVAHTQPRRIAARSTAARIAEELGVPLGEQVGYTHRFDDRSGEDTLVRLMTDGVLLAEISHDRMLRRYDTVIVDEAHERSLTIDFLLGYLTQLLPRRPDLSVVITSATIDAEKFSRHFGGAPVVEVSGRTFPVEVRYRPLVEEPGRDDGEERDGTRGVPDAADDDQPRRGRERDLGDAVGEAVEDLAAEGPGDVLVFLAGERDIRDVASSLTDRPALRGVDLLPLFGRLSAGEQSRVFAPSPRRRVVLATNVAETSLTVPGIRYVVDAGTARISRYSRRTKVQRLPIEPISQASARQRSGRCGRVADGIAIRLYAEDDYARRPEHTEPEVLRTNLAAVVLQMTDLGLGDVAAFPFVDPPDRRAVADGVAVLEELGAFTPGERDPRRRLTPLGRTLARLPVDPRLGRMVLAARDEGCVAEVLVVAAALSIQDPRERPVDAQAAADASHDRFAEPDSDIVTLLNLWRYLSEQRRELSGSRFRRMCREEYLHASRAREWQDLHAQLSRSAEQAGIRAGDVAASPDAVHRAVLAGLLANIARKDDRPRSGREGRRSRGAEYDGARGTRFVLWPGSAVARSAPRFVVAAELVETSRLFARTVAKVEPEWVERLAAHLVTRTYSEPHWSAERGAVVASEAVSLYGVPLVSGRRTGYAHVDPELCRDLFVRHALVDGDWRGTHHRFWQENVRRLADLGALQDKTRRRDLEVDPEALVAFYDARVPADVVSTQHFDRWWKDARRSEPDLLTVDVGALLGDDARADGRSYPDVWRQGDLALPLSYRYAPAEDDDGVTVDVPLPLLPQLDGTGFAWHVPGYRRELVEALLRQLPKDLRVPFVPVPDAASELLAELSPTQGPLPVALSAAALRLRGVTVPPAAWRLDAVPEHLRLRVRAVDGEDRHVASGRDVLALRTRLADRVRAALHEAARGVERQGLRSWDRDVLPATLRAVVDVTWQGIPLRVRPTLVDEGSSVALRVVPSEREQRRLLPSGVRRLLLLSLPNPAKAVLGGLSARDRLALVLAPHGDLQTLLDDCVTCAADMLVAESGGTPTSVDGFTRLVAHARPRLGAATADVLAAVRRVLDAYGRVRERLQTVERRFPDAATDARAQLAALVPAGFATTHGRRRLAEVPRYLAAVEVRLERLPADPQRDAAGLRRVRDVEQAYSRLRARTVPGSVEEGVLDGVRWAVEELRVNVFAPSVPTPYRVSDTRLLRTLDDVESGEARRAAQTREQGRR